MRTQFVALAMAIYTVYFGQRPRSSHKVRIHTLNTEKSCCRQGAWSGDDVVLSQLGTDHTASILKTIRVNQIHYDRTVPLSQIIVYNRGR